jgi:pyruvate,water dikinase
MAWILAAEEVGAQDGHRVGGKAAALAQMARSGFEIPQTWCITTSAYDTFVDRTGLRERIQLELNRKDFSQMRWEEMWDCATRIRHLFLTRPLPPDLRDALAGVLEPVSRRSPLALRSSAPGEDSGTHSFAGLHDSYINIQGIEAVLEHVRRVWASLWKDAALLYRQEIGLTVEDSAMAVIAQQVVTGRCSGIAFSRSPDAETQGMIESVHGLNPGLVDGLIEPDRWRLDRKTAAIVSHTPADRRHEITASEKHGIRLQVLPPERSRTPPLSAQEVETVFRTALNLEELFSGPQDVEWTLTGNGCVILQSRPITSASGVKPEDTRSWYLSLHRSFDNLSKLRRKIEGELIPEMIATAERLQAQDLTGVDDAALAREIRRRRDINQHWVDVYWADFIPYAHGVRLFGQVYNDTLHPEDPYEFVGLLAHSDLISTNRNRLLLEMAERVRRDPGIGEALQAGRQSELPDAFMRLYREFTRQFGDLTCSVVGASHCEEEQAVLVNMISQLARRSPGMGRGAVMTDTAELERRFIAAFEPSQQPYARQLLDLARSSYRLRDDDNIHLGRIEAQLIAAVQEGRRRLDSIAGRENAGGGAAGALHQAVAQFDSDRGESTAPLRESDRRRVKSRQLVGQPAGPGVARGRARIVRSARDAADFKAEEILVCDAIDPNMTFIVPLAAGVVERRGGMLIHGAIIAREYGLPCVTGVPGAVDSIRTGDPVTVDGYLGIVTVE